MRLGRIYRDPAAPLRCFIAGFRRDPRRALRLVWRLTLHGKSWERFSLQIFGKDVVADIFSAGREVEIRPFLMWGTLLGCVRDGGFVARDHDIDVGILAADYPKKDALVAALVRRGYALVADGPWKIKLCHAAGFLHIDIDVLHPLEGRTVTLAFDDDGIVGEAFPTAAFGSLREHVFLEDLSVLVPENPEAVLRAIYGDWRTPRPRYSSGRNPLNRFRLPSHLAHP